MSALIKRIQLHPLAWKAPVLAAVGLMLLGWLLNTPAGLLGKADALGYAVCHRIDVRSFHLGVRQLPLCARCTGMYLGAVLGLLYQYLRFPRRAGTPSRWVIGVLVLFVGAFALDGINSYFSLFPVLPHLYEPNNVLRLLTGTGMGLGIAAALFPAFNQTVWAEYLPEPSLPNLGSLAGLVGLALLLDGAVLSQNPLLLYPLALISAGGVLFLLTLIYTMVWLLILNLENRFNRLNQLLMPLTGGLGLALLQIILLDAGRYLLTGTWDGFHLG